MPRLIFIDDDQQELEDFRDIVGSVYDYTTVHWPSESARIFNRPGPDIFVSDLYLPPRTGDRRPTMAERDYAARAASAVAAQFDSLFKAPTLDDKERLRKTMEAITAARAMLDFQWKALGQSPDHGIALLTEVKARYPDVPFVFYSRKITPEDVITVLQAGAVDAIRKGALGGQEVLARLASAQAIWHQEKVRIVRSQGFNLNVTAIPVA